MCRLDHATRAIGQELSLALCLLYKAYPGWVKAICARSHLCCLIDVPAYGAQANPMMQHTGYAGGTITNADTWGLLPEPDRL